MFYYSTERKSEPVRFREALLTGMPSDNGLYMPESIPIFPTEYFKKIRGMSLEQISFDILEAFIANDIPTNNLRDIVNSAIDFEAPLVSIDEGLSIMELFHGPTLAFKDFGARLMARLMAYYNKDEDSRLLILVATSGDTGSAVASGFSGIDGIDVAILYPSGKVSDVQEKQLTTVGGNVTAFEVDGTFDDCQRLVKEAFLDEDLRSKIRLSSANSINISRLIPQIFYYFYGYSQTNQDGGEVVFSVPSGNFGNVTAGLFAKRMGLPIKNFISPTNINDTFPDYIRTGAYSPRSSVQTISNAMDVGDPSNVKRINDLYDNDINRLSKDLFSWPYSDSLTVDGIRYLYEKFNYIADPHTSVGFLGLNTFRNKFDNRVQGIVLSTAHPAKFIHTVNKALNISVDIPSVLANAMLRDKKSIVTNSSYKSFRSRLLGIYKS